MLIEYVRDFTNKPVGVVVATGPGKVGYAFCHPKDRWNKKLGIKIAEGRANAGVEGPVPNYPIGYVEDALWVDGKYIHVHTRDVLSELIEKMYHRSIRYYK